MLFPIIVWFWLADEGSGEPITMSASPAQSLMANALSSAASLPGEVAAPLTGPIYPKVTKVGTVKYSYELFASKLVS